MSSLRNLFNRIKFKKNGLIKNSLISKNVVLGRKHLITGAKIAGENIFIGNYTSVADNSQILSKFKKIEIGERVSIGPNVLIQNYTHNLNYKITNNEAFIDKYSREKFIEATASTSKDIVIMDDVWIGANCVIMPGIVIGKCAVVGANSLVNRNIGENEVWVGNPARLINKREFH